jgi:XRE family transcriptional regulator, fatty acid utilization regulator
MSRLLAGPRVRLLREQHGLSQAELAARLGISPSYLNQIERDRRALSAAVLLRMSQSLSVEPAYFSADETARLASELRDVLLADPEGAEVPVEEIAQVAARMPVLARAVVALGRGATGADAPHERVRDFLNDRQNYLGSLDEAAERVAELIDAPGGDLRAGLARRLADHGVRLVAQTADAPPGELRRYDRHAHVLRLSPHLRPAQQAFQMALQLALVEHDAELDALVQELPEGEARALARVGLAQYYAGATLMPYRRFHAAAEELAYDIERLAERFRVGFEAACHRLSTLQRPGLRGVPFSFVRVDRAGNVSKRHSANALQFSRGGATCPLWSVYAAFVTPGQIVTQVAETPDGRIAFWVARAVVRKRTGFGMPEQTFALGLGCELHEARRLVYTRGLDLSDSATAVPIGMGCRTCPRTDCAQRALPAADQRLDVDEDRTLLVPYPACT